MGKEVLIVFPTTRQIEYIGKISLNDFKIYIVLQNQYDYSKNHYKNIVFIKKENTKDIEILKYKKLNVLCCHEEAIYWTRINRGNNWKLQFDELYFSILEKHHFKEFFKQKNIHLAKYTLNINNISDYPVIAKPTIGFGSIGVHLLSNKTMCKKYIENFNQMINNCGIYKYQKTYFSDKENKFMFEAQISGNFYRTPFIVQNGICKYVFPVRGISKSHKKTSDFNWIEFEYSLSQTFNKIQMESIINTLIKDFSLTDGVYVAEFIEANDNKLYLLEFSPRQTSGRIAHIIFLATGIDIELEAISIFLQNKPVHDIQKNKQIRLRIEKSNNQFKPLKKYILIENNYECSVYNEKIACKYYEKIKI